MIRLCTGFALITISVLFAFRWYLETLMWNGGGCDFCHDGTFDLVSKSWWRGKLYKCDHCGRELRFYWYRRY